MKSLFLIIGLAIVSTVAGASEQFGVTITTKTADVEGCTALGIVHGGFLNVGFLSGDAGMQDHASKLGANVVLRTSNKLTNWGASGVAYRCAK